MSTYPRSSLVVRFVFTVVLASGGAGCGAHAKSAAPRLETLLPPAAAHPRLDRDYFKGDNSGVISEAELERVLSAPVYLEERARLGVVQVVDKYGVDREIPLVSVPAQLATTLEGSGFFEIGTEVSVDWPATSGIPGLRELAARYRAEYLLLYRHRFVERSYTNNLGWLYVIPIGGLFAPAATLRSEGVLEATLFDVRTGTILFTVLERVGGERDANVFSLARRREALHADLLRQAADRLAASALAKTRVLAAARPGAAAPVASRELPAREQVVADAGSSTAAAAP